MCPLDVVTNNLPEIAAMLKSGNAAVTLKTAEWITGEAKREMGEEKNGIEYIRGEKTHVASAPGEAPAIDTGNLVNSLQAEQVEEINAVAYTDAEYAVPLEFGSTKMESRPFFTPAAFRAGEAAFNYLKEMVASMRQRFGDNGQ